VSILSGNGITVEAIADLVPRQMAFALSSSPMPGPGSPQHSQLSQACAARRIVDHYLPPAGSSDPR
jgi:hypothetical protein